MGEKTNIEWASDSWNPWRGCTKVSPGCVNCYAETLVTTRLAAEHYEVATSETSRRTSRHFQKTAGGHSTSGIEFWGKGAPRIRAVDFNAPLRWNRKPFVCDVCGKPFGSAEAPGSKYRNCWHDDMASYHRRRVFSLSLGDWLDDEVPIEWLTDMLDVIRRCPELDFLLLTKRPENWRSQIEAVIDWYEESHPAPEIDGGGFYNWLSEWGTFQNRPPKNCWIGASVEDQQRADERIPELLKIPAAVRFLSAEPLLGPIDLRWLDVRYIGGAGKSQIDWVIYGGESHQIQAKARPCKIEWIRDGLRQCQAANVAAFVKQLGSNSIESPCPVCGKIGRSVTCEHPNPRMPLTVLKDKKGADWSEWPEDLKVRQWPKPINQRNR